MHIDGVFPLALQVLGRQDSWNPGNKIDLFGEGDKKRKWLTLTGRYVSPESAGRVAERLEQIKTKKYRDKRTEGRTALSNKREARAVGGGVAVANSVVDSRGWERHADEGGLVVYM